MGKSPYRTGGWNYRLVIDANGFVSLREIYYDEIGNPNGVTENPIGDLVWETEAEAIRDLSKMFEGAIHGRTFEMSEFDVMETRIREDV